MGRAHEQVGLGHRHLRHQYRCDDIAWVDREQRVRLEQYRHRLRQHDNKIARQNKG